MLQTRSIPMRERERKRVTFRSSRIANEFIKRHVRKQAILYSSNEHDCVRTRVITRAKDVCEWIDKGAKSRTRVASFFPRSVVERPRVPDRYSSFSLFDQSTSVSPHPPTWNAATQFYFPAVILAVRGRKIPGNTGGNIGVTRSVWPID